MLFSCSLLGKLPLPSIYCYMKKYILRTGACLAIVSSLFSFISCGKKKDCSGGLGSNQINLRFELPVKIYPAKDTFKVGDTMWIEQEFNDQLVNLNNNQTYKFENFNFKASLSIHDLNVDGIYSYQNPLIIVYVGTSKGESGTSMDFEYENNKYHFKAAFIPNRKGLYMMNFGSAIGPKGADTKITECKNEYYEFFTITNGNTDNNYEMMKNAVDPFYKEMTKEKFYAGGGYCFYIKEN